MEFITHKGREIGMTPDYKFYIVGVPNKRYETVKGAMRAIDAATPDAPFKPFTVVEMGDIGTYSKPEEPEVIEVTSVYFDKGGRYSSAGPRFRVKGGLSGPLRSSRSGGRGDEIYRVKDLAKLQAMHREACELIKQKDAIEAKLEKLGKKQEAMQVDVAHVSEEIGNETPDRAL